MALPVSPLNWNIPIVDPATGRPTRGFLTQWNQQSRVNAEIPDASSAAAVSILLDRIGATQGAILRRGSEQWQIVETPGGTSQFLRADGTYAAPDVTVDEGDINLADVLTNNASTMRHGFLPKLSGDDSQYLDGSGQWSTPAGGGGGGGGSKVYALPPNDLSFVTGTSSATFSNIIVPHTDFVVDAIIGVFDGVVGREYSAFVAEIDSSDNILSTLGSAANVFEVTESGAQTQVIELSSPVTLESGKYYAAALVLTSESASTSAQLLFGTSSEFGFSGLLPIDAPVQNDVFGSLTFYATYNQNSDSPSSGSPDTTDDNATMYGVGVRAIIS